MKDWVPLYVAIVGAVAAIGVAFWNSRGDFGDLRQLKALNEVLLGLPDGVEKMLLEQTRNRLVARVARRVEAAPGRRRLVWLIVAFIASVALILAIVLAVVPTLNATVLNVVATVIPAISALATAAIGYRAAERAESEVRAALAKSKKRTRRRSSGGEDD